MIRFIRPIGHIKTGSLMIGAGALSVFSFAPFKFVPAIWISLAIFLIRVGQAPSIRQATWGSFLYSLGFYLANIHWIYISLHIYGNMSILPAISLVLLLSSYLALFPTLAVYLSSRFIPLLSLRLLLALPILWTLGEWCKGWLFTGFPWVNIGYSHLPSTFLAGFSPIFGVYGVSFLVIFSVALAIWGTYFARRYFKYALIGLIILWGTGFGLRFINWTQAYGKPISVSVIQGNISQRLKWQPDQLHQTFHTYTKLIQRSTGELILLPETAFPIFLEYFPAEAIQALRAQAQGRHLIVGVPTFNETANAYYNSAVLISPPNGGGIYHKRHLVPFGEYIPLRGFVGKIVDALSIPLTDFSRGLAQQPPFLVKGQYIALNICYEDGFGAEIIQSLPKATILANISNLAWFDTSIALAQHGQMAQARALESGRPMLRATNTGLTAIINHQGQFVAYAPQRTQAIVTAMVQGRSGLTPYAKMGDKAILAMLALLSIFGLVRLRRYQLCFNHSIM